MLFKYMVLKNNLCIIKNHFLLLLECTSVLLVELTIKGYAYVLITFLKIVFPL